MDSHWHVNGISSVQVNGISSVNGLSLAIQVDFKSSEVGTLKTHGLQRSSVQPTIAFSVNGISSVNGLSIDFKSSEVGTLKTHGLQRSSVQPTIAFSESISNVNLSFCT